MPRAGYVKEAAYLVFISITCEVLTILLWVERLVGHCVASEVLKLLSTHSRGTYRMRAQEGTTRTHLVSEF